MTFSRFPLSPRRLVTAALGLILLALVLVLLPEVMRRVTVSRVHDRLAVPVSITDVDFNPFTGRARVKNLVIGRQDGPLPILQLAGIELRVSYLALLRGRVVLKNLVLGGPRLHVERTESGGWNLLEMLRPSAGNGGPGPDITVQGIRIEAGRLTFVDHAQREPFRLILDAIDFSAGTISTLPELVRTPTTFALKMNLGSGSIAVTGSGSPLGSPSSVEFTARWQRLDPSIFTAYFPQRSLMALSGSRTDGEAHYILAYDQGRATRHDLTATVEMGPARLLAAGGSLPVLTLDKIVARGVEIDLLVRSAAIGELVLTRPKLLIERNEAGVFNVAQIFPGDGGAQAKSPDSPFSIGVAFARTEEGTVEMVDRLLVPTVRSVYREVEISLEGANLAAGAEPGRVVGMARLEGAPVRITGIFKPRPIFTRVRLEAAAVPLESFQGYLAALSGAARFGRDGQMDLTADVVFSSAENGDTQLELSGQAKGRDLALSFPGSERPYFTAEGFAIELDRLRVVPTVEAEFKRVEITGPTLRVERDPGGRWNLGELFQGSGKRGDPSVAPPVIRLNRFDLVRGGIEFTDAAVTPTFSAALSDLTAEVLQVTAADRVAFKINGKLDASTPLELAGSLTLPAKPPGVEFRGTLRNYEISRLNPYAEKYIRYRVRRGRVSAEGDFSFDANGNFSTDNSITLQQLELGEKIDNEFEDKIGISLAGALTLLEGANGEVGLNIPVSGNLNSPEFSAAPVVWKAVQGALVKALTAPFRLIGNVLTLGGKIGEIRIDPIPFLPGTLVVDPAARDRVPRLAEFLKAKPRVKLELRGRSSAKETDAYRQRVLDERIDALKAPNRESAVEALYQEAGGREGEARPAPLQEKEQYLLERIPVSDVDLGRLAEERARAVERALVKDGVRGERLFVVGADENAVAGT
ncbi:MAG TPA: DUF748 domain-containing protein, partial [Candidatus Binatia bacterium]